MAKHLKYNVDNENLTTYLIEDRRSSVSSYGIGNSKLGPNIYTYSKLPGKVGGSCPGSSDECESICFAKRFIDNKWVWKLLKRNSENTGNLPKLPSNAKIVRIHVSGDFDSLNYIHEWFLLAEYNPDVKFFGYTRSWRIPSLLHGLDILKTLPNVFLWASIDKSIKELPPNDWKRAWIEGDERLIKTKSNKYMKTFDGRKAIICPEENGLIQNCEKCTYCFKNLVGDLVFLEH